MSRLMLSAKAVRRSLYRRSWRPTTEITGRVQQIGTVGAMSLVSTLHVNSNQWAAGRVDVQL